MALKDLVADRGKITEEMIEKIIAEYVRYDPNAYEIVLTQAGVVLGNDAKILVILTAVLGWQYVVDETRPVDTRPVALEALTGIPGGTLRPILKKLKVSRLVAVANGHYTVSIANLDAIARTVAGEKAIPLVKRATSRKGNVAKPAKLADESEVAQPTKGKRKSGVPIRASLDRLLDEGFFSEIRTLSQVLARLHELAINAKLTSLSGPIADLVRDGKLARKKVTHGTKTIWGYIAV